MKDKGVNVLGINLNDSPEDIMKFRKEFKLSMPLLIGGTGDTSVTKKYGVKVYPTNLVIDKDGMVVAQIIGGDMKAIKEALAKAGIH